MSKTLNTISPLQARALLALGKVRSYEFLRSVAESKPKAIPTKKKIKSKVKRASGSNSLKNYRSDLISKATESEIAFKAILDDMKIHYCFQKIFQHPKKSYIVDFYCTKTNIVFEIDGGYHNMKKQQELDRKRTEDLRTLHGVNAVVRFTNNEVICTPEIARAKISKNHIHYSK